MAGRARWIHQLESFPRPSISPEGVSPKPLPGVCFLSPDNPDVTGAQL